MSVLKITTILNRKLRKKAKPVKKFDAKLAGLVENMIETIAKGKRLGVGLSAPQIGKSIKLFICFDKEVKSPLVFVNPTITFKSKALTNDPAVEDAALEGCLSVPEIYGLVKRSKTIKIKWQDLKGKIQEKEFSDFFSTVVQHEYDHLEGILFTDRVKEQGGKLYKLEKTEEKEELVEIKK